MTKLTPNLALALHDARLGIPVFPCWESPDEDGNGFKRPYNENGCRGATTDIAQITEWWSQWPNALPGIATGHLFDAIDKDVKGNKPGEATYARAVSEGMVPADGIFSNTTPTGGGHVLVPPSGETIYTDPSPDKRTGAYYGTGLDYRGIGGYIISPGAVAEDGRKWSGKITRAHLNRLKSMEPVEFIPWLKDLKAESRAALGLNGNGEAATALNDKVSGDAYDRIAAAMQARSLGAHEDSEGWRSACPLCGITRANGTPRDARAVRLRRGATQPYVIRSECHTADELLYALGLPDLGARHVIADLRNNEIGSGDGQELEFLSWHDLQNMPPNEPLIEGWLDRRGAVSLIGDWGTNKSFLLLDWALSIAAGHEEWLGHKIYLKAPVLILVGEGMQGLPRRVAAWQEANEYSDAEMEEIWASVHIARPRGRTLLDDGLWYELADKATRFSCRVVVLDTMSSLTPEMDETKDVPKIIANLVDLAEHIDGATILAHHTGWGEKTRARGGSQQEGNFDVVLTMQKIEDEDNLVSLRLKKNKDGEAGKRIGLRRVLAADSRVLELADLEDGRGNMLKAWNAVRTWVETSEGPCNVTEFFTNLGIARTGEVGQRLGKAREDCVRIGWLIKVPAPKGRSGVFYNVGPVNPHVLKTKA